MNVFKALLPGLLVAQIIATIQVYLSNAGLYRAFVAMREAGYLVVPNQNAVHYLKEFAPAFFGGLFFTLTVGAGLSLLTLAAVWTWDRVFSRSRIFMSLLLLSWVGCLLWINSHGFSTAATAYFVFVPVVVSMSTLKWMPARFRQKTLSGELVPVIPLLLLALLWLPRAGGDMFLDIRDNLLLSNSFGTKISDFYYGYTLYPAEAFKSLDQKTLRTCRLEGIKDESTVKLLEKELLKHDYLNIRGYSKADLEIIEEGGMLVFRNRGNTILRTASEDFLAAPGEMLREFSLKSDRHSFFRKFTFFCLLTGSPVILYVALYALFRIVFRLFMAPKKSSVAASILCVTIVAVILSSLYFAGRKTTEVDNLSETMESGHWRQRVMALKIVEQKGMEIGNFRAYKKMLKSPYIPERYWLTKAMGKSRKTETYNDLRFLLNDPNQNVVCMAFYALGERKDPGAVGEIIKRISTSGDWYSQQYAYRALRRLGWKQTGSK
ncbi:MAG: HEAT repeat domain-containing protein [Deltaproteobacteria bacterium]|nr:HEAT repeat domain-containing protein [Deltaproteobacteria bacterium]